MIGDAFVGTTPTGLLGACVAVSTSGPRLSVAMSAFEELVQVPDPVRVYDWNGTTWDQRGTIQITGGIRGTSGIEPHPSQSRRNY